MLDTEYWMSEEEKRKYEIITCWNFSFYFHFDSFCFSHIFSICGVEREYKKKTHNKIYKKKVEHERYKWSHQSEEETRKKNTQFNVILEKAKQTNTNEDKKKFFFHIFFIFFFLCVHELYKLSMKWAYETFRDIE